MICPSCRKTLSKFEGCAACLLAGRCAMVRCPDCGHEFLKGSRLASWLMKWREKKRKDQSQTSDERPISRVGEAGCYRVKNISLENRSSVNRLVALGVTPGTLIKLTQKHPAYVIRVGETDLAIDARVADGIWVESP